MSFRTNRNTRGIFIVPTSRLGRFESVGKTIPKETRHYEKVAKRLGMSVRYEIQPMSKLKSRGFVEHEDVEGSEARKQYIREHLNEIPFIVIRGRENDIIDGNHRWVTFMELGIERCPVLRVIGTKAQLSKFEDFVQDYNKHPPWIKDAQFGKNPRTKQRTIEKNPNLRAYLQTGQAMRELGPRRAEALKKYGAMVEKEDDF